MQSDRVSHGSSTRACLGSPQIRKLNAYAIDTCKTEEAEEPPDNYPADPPEDTSQQYPKNEVRSDVAYQPKDKSHALLDRTWPVAVNLWALRAWA
jgi:hypothetical protein